MNDKESKFKSFIKSIIEKKPHNYDELNLKTTDKELINIPDNGKNRIMNGYHYPLREIILLGKDENGPGFLVLYGLHNSTGIENDRYVLDEDVKYNGYAIFKGSQGHFPSFESVFLQQPNTYPLRLKQPALYKKSDIKNYAYWNRDSLKQYQNYYNFDIDVSFPYFKNISHEQYVNALKIIGIEKDGFTLVANQNEILDIDLMPHSELILKILTSPGIYQRKKYLNQLIDESTNTRVFEYLFKIGSCELISGMLLEFAKRKDDRFIDQAKQIVYGDVSWVSGNYLEGLRRCASIYINVFDEAKRNERIDFLKSSLNDLYFIPLKVWKRDVAKNMSNAQFQRYAIQGAFYEYEYRYVNRKYEKIRRQGTFEKNYYNDGVVVDIVKVKSTIQEAIIYDMPDILIKMAYYLDSPRLHYTFIGAQKTKALNYLKKCIRRELDFYAKNDEQKFVDLMKVLFTSYQKDDAVSNLGNYFQSNYFIKKLLYGNFEGNLDLRWCKTGDVWKYCSPLLLEEGRFEKYKDIWDRNTGAALYIAENSKVEEILKAFYSILKDSIDYLKNLDYSKVIKMLKSEYKPIANLFLDVLNEKLKLETTFNISLMIDLLQSGLEKSSLYAAQYLQRTEGYKNAEGIISLLFFEKINIDVFADSIDRLESKAYIEFLNKMFENSDKFKEYSLEWTDELKNIINNSLEKLAIGSAEEKLQLILNITDDIANQDKQSYIYELMINALFSISYDDLKILAQQIDFSNIKNEVSVLLQSIIEDSLPNGSVIVDVFKFGTPKMIKMLVEIVRINKEQLKTNLSTLLLLLESQVTALNDIAKSVFESMHGQMHKEMHMMIIDSPDTKVYRYGIEQLDAVYGYAIPIDFITQMLEHSSADIKAYISNKLNSILNGNLSPETSEIFIYYAKTLLLMPNKKSFAKQNIYNKLPKFVLKNPSKQQEIEDILLQIGASNIISDSERALVALAKIRKEVA